jgi:uncharacterized phosphosugar-binding protein
MLKMFTTQLTGVLKKISEKEALAVEDAARLLAQGPAGNGNICLLCFGEMKAAAYEALEGAEGLHSAKIVTADNLDVLTNADRVLILSRFSTDKEAVNAASALIERGIPFAAVSSVLEKEETGDLTDLADVHIDLGLIKGLLPDEEGGRFGFPSSILGLFVYFCLKFTIDEILAEYE